MSRRNSATPLGSSCSNDKEDKCGDCKKNVLAKENGLQCEVCEDWFHAKCQKVSDDAYKFLGKNDCMHWYCKTCDKGVVKMLQSLQKLETRQDKLETEMTEMKDMMVEMKADIQTIKDLASTTDTKLETMVEAKLVESWESRVESSVGDKVRIVKEDVAESMEIEKRKTNLIFYGVKECEVLNLDNLNVKHPDQEMIEEIMKTGLNVDASRHIDDVQRIGRFVTGKLRPLRVKVKSFEARNEILKRAKNLKENQSFEKIYITPDLTRKQQVVDKELRDKLRKYKEDGIQNVRIRGGKIVKNGQGGQVEILFQPLQN